MSDLKLRPEYGQFKEAVDRLQRTSPDGQPYWHARDLMPVLGYASWESFEAVIERASKALRSTGLDPENHIRGTGEMVTIGSGAKRERADYFLSRYACYATTLEGDPAKPEVAFAKAYFQIQTRIKEVEDQREDLHRLKARNEMKEANKNLGKAAQAAGVQKYAVFHDAGYKGLYDGLGQDAIKAKKGIPEDEKLLDCIDETELAANAFRATQAKEKLVREQITGEQRAIDTHRAVGKVVRDTIASLGGTMPEDRKAVPSIKKLAAAGERKAKRLKQPRIPMARCSVGPRRRDPMKSTFASTRASDVAIASMRSASPFN